MAATLNKFLDRDGLKVVLQAVRSWDAETLEEAKTAVGNVTGAEAMTADDINALVAEVLADENKTSETNEGEDTNAE